MPGPYLYPGVYVEELPSGVRTITGVATSITVFLGRTAQGPTKATTINSLGDFERTFGQINKDYPVSYAVRDFYINGGSQAIVVRLFNDAVKGATKKVVEAAIAVQNQTPAEAALAARAEADKNTTRDPIWQAADSVAKAAEAEAARINDPQPTFQSVIEEAKKAAKATPDSKARFDMALPDNKKLTLEASSPGVWGNQLHIQVNYDGINQDVADQYQLATDDLFNLVVENSSSGKTELFRNVSVNKIKSESRRLDRVLKQESNLISAPMPPDGAKRPVETKTKNIEWEDPFSGGVKSDQLNAAAYIGDKVEQTGLYALDRVDLFNILCIPPDSTEEGANNVPKIVYQNAMNYCKDKRAILIVDPPSDWKDANDIKGNDKLTLLGLNGPSARNAVIYFPRVFEADPLRGGQVDVFVPCGIMAGVIAQTDATRGVWKAPAGIDAGLNGIQGLELNMSDEENGMLNPLGINCLRTFPVYGSVSWGARTLRGADQIADEYKYLPVRRTALFIEESLYRGLKWAVFEPNDEPLWCQIRLNVGAFMHNLYRQGAFQGSRPSEAYFVKCDKETTTQNDINLGIVNVVVGFAPLKPAEFVVIKLQQIAGQIQT